MESADTADSPDVVSSVLGPELLGITAKTGGILRNWKEKEADLWQQSCENERVSNGSLVHHVIQQTGWLLRGTDSMH